MSRRELLLDTLDINWAFDLSHEQRAILVTLAARYGSVRPYAWKWDWRELTGAERDAIIRAARALLELAELLSGDLSGPV